MEKLKEKYLMYFSNKMGSFTFENESLTEEILKDFKGWYVTKYQDQTIFYLK